MLAADEVPASGRPEASFPQRDRIADRESTVVIDVRRFGAFDRQGISIPARPRYVVQNDQSVDDVHWTVGSYVSPAERFALGAQWSENREKEADDEMPLAA